MALLRGKTTYERNRIDGITSQFGFMNQPILSIFLINPYFYVDHIRKAINSFQWKKSLQNMNVTDIIHLFNRTVQKISYSFISHEIITFDDRDPAWIDSSKALNLR